MYINFMPDENKTTKEKPLNKSQKEFLDEYFLNGGDAIAAHRKAYPKCKESSHLSEAYRKLEKLRNSQYFAAKNSEQLRKNEEFKKEIEQKHKIDREWLLEQNKKIYESAMTGDFIPTENGSYTKLDRGAACKAIDQITKIVGEYADIKAKLQLDGDAIATIKVVREEIK